MAVWEKLLDDKPGGERVAAPWLGEARLRVGPLAWVVGQRPRQHGWYEFAISGRRCLVVGPAEPRPETLGWIVRGYLVGDRLVADGARASAEVAELIACSERVNLIEPGLDRFARAVAGRTSEKGPLVYAGPDMPLGPETDALAAYLRREQSLDARGATPALCVAFKIETEHRATVERARAAEEARRRLEEARERLGSAEGRRATARAGDFAAAARAALAVGDAEYLDHVAAPRRGEAVVRYRLDGRVLECVCDAASLRIVDAGICLTSGGERGDDRFTLESLPAVVRQADRERVLVVLRRAPGFIDDYDDQED